MLENLLLGQTSRNGLRPGDAACPVHPCGDQQLCRSWFAWQAEIQGFFS